jgi:hypothetical protein
MCSIILISGADQATVGCGGQQTNQMFAMDDNPYRAPMSEGAAIGVVSGRAEDVRSVAVFQKGVLVCILLYLCAGFGQFLIPAQLRPLVGLGVLIVILAGATFVFLLAIKVYGTGLGVLFGLLTLIPCVGLIVLLIVNGKATNVLRQNGYKVGLLGAKL